MSVYLGGLETRIYLKIPNKPSWINGYRVAGATCCFFIISSSSSSSVKLLNATHVKTYLFFHRVFLMRPPLSTVCGAWCPSCLFFIDFLRLKMTILVILNGFLKCQTLLNNVLPFLCWAPCFASCYFFGIWIYFIIFLMQRTLYCMYCMKCAIRIKFLILLLSSSSAWVKDTKQSDFWLLLDTWIRCG